MTETQTAENYTPLEEIFNSLTHGIWILISLAGMVLMIVFASRYGNVNHIVSCTIFGLTLVMLYTASTLYHSFRKPTLKHVFKICDHSCIYLLIAGTYTPFLMVTLKGMLGWSLFAVVWTLTAAGILFKIFFVYRFNILSTIAYILMGWIIIFAVKPLLHSLPEGGIAFLVAGGLAYTLGTIFYAWKKLPFNHAIWHLFVLGGSICHFLAVILYVIPGPSI